MKKDDHNTRGMYGRWDDSAFWAKRHMKNPNKTILAKLQRTQHDDDEKSLAE